MLAWAAGSVFGVLAVNTTLYVGPLADIAGGVDLSTVGSAVIAAVIYAVAGLAAATFVAVLGLLPAPLVATVAGLALLSPFLGGLMAMVQNTRDIEAAAVTFLVTGSGISLLGVGAAFWGLLAGLAVWGLPRLWAAR